MPLETATEEEAQAGGAPPWMLTYGDSVTLLLTFFVLLLTFSTPSEEDFQQFARGLLRGSRAMGLFGPETGANNLGPDERRMAASRLEEEGAEKPPVHGTAPLSELRYHYADVDVSQLPDLKGAVLIRMRLVELFGTQLELVPAGRERLDHIVKMCRAKKYSVVVRAAVGGGLPEAQRRERSLLLATRVVDYLRAGAGKACEDIGLSDNVRFEEVPLAEGQCEITMLEV